MTHNTKTRAAEPTPWFRAWPGVEQLLTEGMTSRELALWHTLRLKFWAAGCRPMSKAAIERAAALQNMVDAATGSTAWASAILVAERGMEERPGEGWSFTDLLDQHAQIILSKAKSAEAGRKGGQMRRKTAPADGGTSTSADPYDF